jgi:hypothetical protein
VSAIPLPPGLEGRIKQWIRDEVAKLLRSGFLRSASIGEGGLTLRGGFFRLRNRGDSSNAFYIGPLNPALPDGTAQQGWIVRRDDGTTVLMLRDVDVADGQVNQALNWYDRSGNIVLADDTDGGQGLARPYVPFAFYRSRDVDWPTITSTSFQTVYRARGFKQQPKLYAEAWGWNDTGSATGEVRVLVNGVQLGGIASTDNTAVKLLNFGPDAVAGDHTSTILSIEIQARVASGSGGVRVGAAWAEGRQT